MLKRLLFILLTVAAILPNPLHARDFQYTYEGQTIWYTVLDEDAKTCEIKPGVKYSGSIILPNKPKDGIVEYTLTKIGDKSFFNCSEIKTLSIPSSITAIGDSILEGCNKLKDIIVDGDNPYYSSIEGVLYNKKQSLLIHYPSAKDNISYIIPNSVIEINKNALKNCSKLTSVTIPSSVNIIGSSNFAGCTGLTDLIFEDKDESIQMDQVIFDNCPLETLYLGRRLSGITFSNLVNLRKITIGSTVKAIRDEEFNGCSSLTKIQFPNTLNKIGSNAFYGCSGLTSVEIPRSVFYLGKDAFAECSNLREFIFPGELCSYSSVDIFSGCTALERVIMGNYTDLAKFVPVEATIYTFKQYLNDYANVNATVKLMPGIDEIEINSKVDEIELKIIPNKGVNILQGLDGIHIDDALLEQTISSKGQWLYIPVSVPSPSIQVYYNTNNSWIQRIYTNGAPNGIRIYQIYVKENTTGNTREGYVEIYAGTKKFKIKITQSAESESNTQSDIQITPTGGTASSAQVNDPISESFDNDISTIYLSYWKSTMPISLYYYFEGEDQIDYIEYIPRQGGGNGCFKEFEVYISEDPSHDDFEKIGEYNFIGSSVPGYVIIPEKKNPTCVKFIIKSAVGNYVSCAEMRFFRYAARSNSKPTSDNIETLQSFSAEMKQTGGINGNKCTFTDLEPDSNYLFTIKFSNEYSDEWLQDIECSTLKLFQAFQLKKATQSTLTIHIEATADNRITDLYTTIPKLDSQHYYPDKNGDITVTGLKSNTSYGVYGYCRLKDKEYEPEMHYYSTLGVKPNISVEQVGPTSISFLPTLNEGDADIYYSEFVVNDTKLVPKRQSLVNLPHGIPVQVSYKVNNELMSCAIDLPDLELTTIAARAASKDCAIICAETNMSEEEYGGGFEWRRYDAPEMVPSTFSPCPVANGHMEGRLRGLSSNTYYKYRPYYEDCNGDRTFGEWTAFITADADVYFEPTVYTYAPNTVTKNSATVVGYAIGGSEDVDEQGFEYWAMSASRVTTDVRRVLATGQRMIVTLEDLEPGTHYTVRAFATTKSKTTYGENQEFETDSESESMIEPVTIEEADVQPFDIYTLNGICVRRHTTDLSGLAPGLYIANGKKILVH